MKCILLKHSVNLFSGLLKQVKKIPGLVDIKSIVLLIYIQSKYDKVLHKRLAYTPPFLFRLCGGEIWLIVVFGKASNGVEGQK